ncbi:hypothetical protein [Nodularia sp. LEGE 04288]|uniref:hypothetical protein n=1 Tax=Nodularia sp. LEGE 04288 TaxID=1828639 RepID=UPI001D1060A1|nr:hypothetical protein [Nodularia sp. LEGE 04288]MCC2695214.1 hypothetical protein [Nodularia sp. LEGE 04288]
MKKPKLHQLKLLLSIISTTLVATNATTQIWIHFKPIPCIEKRPTSIERQVAFLESKNRLNVLK